MARSFGVSVENAFTRGLITEVTGVNSPENSVTDTLNVSYDRRGRAIKRMGFEYELDHATAAIDGEGVHLEYLWETVSDNISLDFVVVQIGNLLYFYESSGSGALSSGLKGFTVNLLSYKTPPTTIQSVRDNYASFASGKGYLFVAHPSCETIRIAYNTTTDSLTVSPINIQIRDLEGLDDGLSIDNRPHSISNEHKYNLFNQGWYARATVDALNDVVGSPYEVWENLRIDWPSNKDVWWYYLRADDQGSDTGGEWFDTNLIDRQGDLYGNTPAAKGHYILDAFEINRSAVSGVGGLPNDSSSGQRPSVVAFYAGRAFYAGVGKSGFSQKIYFSQIVENDDQFGKCYQKNDPTSREISDLLDDDGGVITIPDINNIYDIRVVGESIIVFASNGIWNISGTDNGPFRATDYTISRLSTFPAINRTTVALVSGTPVWWNYEGIFTLKVSDIGLTKEVTSLTAQTIQSFYDDIPPKCKVQAKGVFNDQEGLLYWLYSDNSDTPSTFTKILVLDAITGAFYTYSLPTQGPSIIGIISIRSITAETSDDFVIDNAAEQVVTTSNDPLIVSTIASIEVSNKVFKFLTSSGGNVSFAEIRSTLYLDWGLYGYESYFTTGYRVRGEMIREAQTNYLTVLSEAIPNSSCYVQALWNYSNHPDSGHYSNPQQVYRNIDDRTYVRSRLKMRGNGYSLQFRFYGENGKPFRIIGWAGYDSVSGNP